jgi:hypothetical protein
VIVPFEKSATWYFFLAPPPKKAAMILTVMRKWFGPDKRHVQISNCLQSLNVDLTSPAAVQGDIALKKMACVSVNCRPLILNLIVVFS